MTKTLTTRELLLKRAGLTPAMVQRGKTDEFFTVVMDALSDIYKGKQVLYGNYLETHGGDPTQFALMEHFSDIKRKYVRAQAFMKEYFNGSHDMPLDELLDTYSDLAVYGAIGVQLVLHLIAREQRGTSGSIGGGAG